MNWIYNYDWKLCPLVSDQVSNYDYKSNLFIQSLQISQVIKLYILPREHSDSNSIIVTNKINITVSVFSVQYTFNSILRYKPGKKVLIE